MRVAWFRAERHEHSDPDGAWSACMDLLTQMLSLEIITEARAHDFVIEQALRPYDLCVFEPRTTAASDFIWAYLFQYPGIVLVQDASLHDSRVRTLERRQQGARYRDEFTFNHGHAPPATGRPFPRGTWPMLRAPILTSLAVAVPDNEPRLALAEEYPGTTIYTVLSCAAGPPFPTVPAERPESPLRVTSLQPVPPPTLVRAVERANSSGTPITFLPRDRTDPRMSDVDTAVHLGPPSDNGTLLSVLGAMAHERPVIVLEGEATASLPALDPQTWQPRDAVTSAEPAVVSLDPRDEEHSLMLALQGLARTRSRATRLGRAARQWWLDKGTPQTAAEAWKRVLENAIDVPLLPRPHGWPPHLSLKAASREHPAVRQSGSAVDDRTTRTNLP